MSVAVSQPGMIVGVLDHEAEQRQQEEQPQDTGQKKQVRDGQPRRSALRVRLQAIEETDSNAVPCPAYWEHKFLSERLLASCHVTRAIYLVCPTTAAATVAHYAEVPQNLNSVLWVVVVACYSNFYVLLGLFLPSLRRMAMSGGNEDELGTLVKLKASRDNPVPKKGEAAAENSRVMISEAGAKSLNCWHKILQILSAMLIAGGIPIALASVVDPGRTAFKDPFSADQPWDTGAVVCQIVSYAGFYGCVAPLACMWLSALSVAATVADDAVIEVIRKVADLNPIDDLDEWIEHVERPAVSLHYETMAALSQGFGTGIVSAWVGCWTLSFGFFVLAGASAGVESNMRIAGTLGVGFLAAIAPLLLVHCLAQVGSRCDDLHDALNDKVLKDLRYHGRLDALIKGLRRLNNGQGLGFSIAGLVLDKRTLGKIFLGIASLCGTIGPAVMLLRPQSSAAAAGDCTLNDAVRTHARVSLARSLTPGRV